MLIDCDTCAMRDIACSDCVVSVLLGSPAPDVPVHLDETEQAAIGVLADSGLVPPLRLVRPNSPPESGGTYDDRRAGGAARAG